MCWIATNNEELIPKIAEDNIPVEKIVRLGTTLYNEEYLYSAYFGKIYKLNMTYKTSHMRLIDNYIEEGFHSYKGIKIVIDKEDGSIYIYGKDNKKLDSWYNYNKAIMSCVIPKGSIYYENRHGEIVSNAIKPIYCYKIK